MVKRLVDRTVLARGILLAGAAALGLATAAFVFATGGPYPIVTEPQVQHTPPMTTANGAVVSFPVNPTVYRVAPSPTCERMLATFHDGSKPTRRPIVIPPRPGLRAEALSSHRIRLHWWFAATPSDCRPGGLLISIVANGDPRATPTTLTVRISGRRGSSLMTYPSFLPRPNVAMARAQTSDGRSSRTARVLISG
jgi:hypothetical protein